MNMHRAQRQINLSKPKRKDTPAYSDNNTKRFKDKLEAMELPEVIVESKDSDVDSGIKDVNDSNAPTPTTSMASSSNPGSPRFIVNPVSSGKSSEEHGFHFDKIQTMADNEYGDLEEKGDDDVQVVIDAKESNNPRGSGVGSASVSQMSKERNEVTEESGSLNGRKISETRSFDSQPKSRKVSFRGDGQRNAQFYLPDDFRPGYIYVPSPAHSRKVSTDSFYGQQPSRKTSLNAFYYPGPGLQGLPHHKISVFSMQSVDSDRTFTDTHEVLPHEDHYRDLMNVFDFARRPTLFELREDEKLSEPRSPGSVNTDLLSEELSEDKDEGEREPVPLTSAGLKFGWIQGVLVRCLLNIFGVMLFLRLTWITGQAGVGLASVIILLSMGVTLITTMSMSAICTNGEVKGGGAYYMISRSLGPEFGGSIGIVFSLANAVAAAMYVVGFAETVRDIMWENSAYITGDSLHEVRIIGIATCFLLIAIVLIGMEWEAKAQLGLLVILTLAILNYFVGTFLPTSDEKKWKGVMGYTGQIFTENFGPSFRGDNSFFSVFAIFFPAATGILAGANISGDLKDPQKAIPKGTFLAIIITGIVYLLMVWTAGATTLRDAIGPVGAIFFGNYTANRTAIPSIELVASCMTSNHSCEFGLLNDNGMVGVSSAWRPLILAGIFSATLSSALASMVGAPKVFQALGKDKLFPGVHFFAKGYGKGGEPRRGYVLTFAVCMGMTCIGSLDLIAPIISNFFLMAYALINYSCFDASIANTPGFRPAFKYYSKWASLLGALLCLGVMFLINWWAALVTFVIVAGLYVYVKVKKPDVNWGSSTQAHAYREALKTSLKLVSVEEHILVLSGFPRNRAALVDLASSITKKQSLLICGHVFQGELSEHLKHLRSTSAYRWFKTRKVKAFYNSVAAPTFRIGVQVLLQALGLGKLKPNTLLIGYKSDWIKADPRDVFDYYNVIQDAFDLNYGVGVLRIPEGLDRHKVPDELLDYNEESDDEFEISDDDEPKSPDVEEKTASNSLYATKSPDGEGKATATNDKSTEKKTTPTRRSGQSYSPNVNKILLKRLSTLDEGMENLAFEPEMSSDGKGSMPSKPVLSPAISVDKDTHGNRFREVQCGTIDVWWLYDDGGLTLLVPYILSQRKRWKNCKLRVFCAGTKKGQISADQMRMATLLSKFRIDYAQLTVIPDLSKKPQLATYKEFESLIHSWRLRSGEFQEEYMWKISDADLIAHKKKTYRHLRIRELLKQHSSEASLVVMTLPVPRKSACPAGLYMGWLEIITRDMPPILLLRGNQQSVLTYYS